MSGYGAFSYFYDRLTGNVDYPAIADAVERYIGRFGGRKGILLDVACGTGSLCEQLARRGFDVIGTDSSPEMLGVALDKKFDSGLPIQYLCQEMTALDMFGTIDVTVSRRARPSWPRWSAWSPGCPRALSRPGAWLPAPAWTRAGSSGSPSLPWVSAPRF